MGFAYFVFGLGVRRETFRPLQPISVVEKKEGSSFSPQSSKEGEHDTTWPPSPPTVHSNNVKNGSGNKNHPGLNHDKEQVRV